MPQASLPVCAQVVALRHFELQKSTNKSTEEEEKEEEGTRRKEESKQEGRKSWGLWTHAGAVFKHLCLSFMCKKTKKQKRIHHINQSEKMKMFDVGEWFYCFVLLLRKLLNKLTDKQTNRQAVVVYPKCDFFISLQSMQNFITWEKFFINNEFRHSVNSTWPEFRNWRAFQFFSVWMFDFIVCLWVVGVKKKEKNLPVSCQNNQSSTSIYIQYLSGEKISFLIHTHRQWLGEKLTLHLKLFDTNLT